MNISKGSIQKNRKPHKYFYICKANSFTSRDLGNFEKVAGYALIP